MSPLNAEDQRALVVLLVAVIAMLAFEVVSTWRWPWK